MFTIFNVDHVFHFKTMFEMSGTVKDGQWNISFIHVRDLNKLEDQVLTAVACKIKEINPKLLLFYFDIDQPQV